MANAVCEILITKEPLRRAVSESGGDSGAIVEFFGIVRRDESGREIEGIDYEAHLKMAEHQLGQIAAKAADRFSLQRLIVHHRIGFVAVGEASLFLQARAKHREAAFEACKWIVDELKQKVPIWKRPKFRAEAADGAAETAGTTAGPRSATAATMK